MTTGGVGKFIWGDSGAILAAGKTFRNWFPYDSRNVRLWLVVCFVKNHVAKFAFIYELTAFSTLIEVLFLGVVWLIKISRIHFQRVRESFDIMAAPLAVRRSETILARS